jgi:hypothetical protein
MGVVNKLLKSSTKQQVGGSLLILDVKDAMAAVTSPHRANPNGVWVLNPFPLLPIKNKKFSSRKGNGRSE